MLLSVSERLAPRFVAKPGASTGMLIRVQGMTLERYAQLLQLLEPFGVRLSSVEGDKVVFEVSGSTDQLRSQLSLAKLQGSACNRSSRYRNAACCACRCDCAGCASQWSRCCSGTCARTDDCSGVRATTLFPLVIRQERFSIGLRDVDD